MNQKKKSKTFGGFVFSILCHISVLSLLLWAFMGGLAVIVGPWVVLYLLFMG
jgi:hypothetical protein